MLTRMNTHLAFSPSLRSKYLPALQRELVSCPQKIGWLLKSISTFILGLATDRQNGFFAGSIFPIAILLRDPFTIG